MVQITFVASYALTQHPAIRNRLAAYIKEGLTRGHTIRLISPDKVLQEAPESDLFEHVSIKESPVHGSNFIKRALAESVVAWRALRAAHSYRDEYVVISIPSMFLLFLSPLFSRKHWCLDARDLSWEYLSDQSFLFRSIKLTFRSIAKYAVRHYRCAITTNETDQNYVVNTLNVPLDRALLIYNGVSAAQFELLSSIRSYDEGHASPRLGDEQAKRPVTVSYIGNVGLAQNLMTLVRAAERLPHVRFNIVGAGSDFERVRDKASVLNVENLTLWGRVSWDKVPELYASSDVLYAQLASDYARAMPSKLYEYLCAGRHIIYGGGAQAKAILSRFQSYEVIPPDDVEALVKAISNFVGNSQCAASSNRRIIEEHFIRENNVRMFYDYLKFGSKEGL